MAPAEESSSDNWSWAHHSPKCASTGLSTVCHEGLVVWRDARVYVRSKYFYSLVCGQALCVAVGLWMQHGLTRTPLGSGTSNDTSIQVAMVTFLWIMVLLSITVYLALRRWHETLAQERASSESELMRHTQTLVRTRDAIIFALAKLAGCRDHETGGHLERISDYASLLAAALRYHPKLRREATPAFARLIGLSAVLHDIGKVGIEDLILRKPGPLTATERQRMQLHTVLAGDCLQGIARRLGDSDFLTMAREIALAHHERWDGGGYPNGLKGEKIPLAARIVAIADVYDALSTQRPYKPALPHAECMAIIRDEAGKQFDPDLVDVWLTLEPKLHAIARRYAPSAPECLSGQHGPAGEPSVNAAEARTLWPETVDVDTHTEVEERATGSVARTMVAQKSVSKGART